MQRQIHVKNALPDAKTVSFHQLLDFHVGTSLRVTFLIGQRTHVEMVARLTLTMTHLQTPVQLAIQSV